MYAMFAITCLMLIIYGVVCIVSIIILAISSELIINQLTTWLISNIIIFMTFISGFFFAFFYRPKTYSASFSDIVDSYWYVVKIYWLLIFVFVIWGSVVLGINETTHDNIFKFFNYGVHLREVILPLDNPGFKMILDKSGDKWRANMIILGKKFMLYHLETFKCLIESGADININNSNPLRWAAKRGLVDVVKYLVESGADININDNSPLRWSARRGHIDVVKYLVESGADIHARNDYALILSARKGYFNVVKYLVESGANIHACNDALLRECSRKDYQKIADYLVESGANEHVRTSRYLEKIRNYSTVSYFFNITSMSKY